MHPKNLSISDFDYDLPEEKIPAFPLEERDASRLLVYQSNKISEDKFKSVSNYIPKHSLLVFNKTKVVPARIVFIKTTGGAIEIFCLEPDDRYRELSSAMYETGNVYWKCLVGGASKWKNGQILEKSFSINEKLVILNARFISKKDDHFIIEFFWTPAELSFAFILQSAGAIPLPPYIKREVTEADQQRYQTVYAEREGSVAAPTAGLHFTKEIIDSLIEKGIVSDYVTLHVGAGTFKPVKTEIIADHVMHSEWLDVSIQSVRSLRNHLGRNIVAVGTTSLRTIESLYWLGRKIILSNPDEIPSVSQWEPYENKKTIPAIDALSALIDFMERKNLDNLVSKTGIIIAPGYNFQVANGLVTNFHQPRSTLLLLVAAFIGEKWKNVYDYALKNNFRFLSYGDGSILWRN